MDSRIIFYLLFCMPNAQEIEMQTKRINLNYAVFFTLCITLISAISTVIFSEKPFNDNFGFSLMFFAIIGLCLNMSHIFMDTIRNICNP